MKVSVCLPAYNHEAYIAEAIESVLSQSFSDFELLIGDDGSPDGTVQVIKRYNDPRIRTFFHEKNYGATFNHRFLLEQARGEYIALINSDDVWLQGKLEKQVAYLDTHKDTVLCSGWAKFIDENGNDLELGENVFQQPNRTQAEWIEHLFCCGNCICHPGVLIRRTAYEKLDYYRLALRQLPDYEMWTRMIREGNFYIFQEPLVVHRRFIGNSKNTSSPLIDNSIRDVMESYFILSNYLETLPDDLFSAAFRKYFHNKHAITPTELQCERFFLLEGGQYYMKKIYKQAAIMFFYRNYDANMAKTLRETYHYTLKEFFELSCQVDLLGLRDKAPIVSAMPKSENIPNGESALAYPDTMEYFIRTHRLKTIVMAIIPPNSKLFRILRTVYRKYNKQ